MADKTSEATQQQQGELGAGEEVRYNKIEEFGTFEANQEDEDIGSVGRATGASVGGIAGGAAGGLVGGVIGAAAGGALGSATADEDRTDAAADEDYTDGTREDRQAP